MAVARKKAATKKKPVAKKAAIKKAAKKPVKKAVKKAAAKKLVKKAAKKSSKYLTSDGQSYLTKRLLLTKARAAGRKATSDAMRTMGYIVVSHHGTVIRKFADGRIETIQTVNR
jgi:hypothetical protein